MRDRDEFDSKFQDFSSYLKKDFANAAVAFTQVLGIDPKNREALYELSLLAFTAGMFREFVQYQERILELDPNDKNTHLFLGLGYHRIKNYESAFREYNIARSLMEKDELLVFDSIDYIIPSEKRKLYKQASIDGKSEFEEKFWRKRDPLFLTEYNERILEHYSRVAFSNLKFTPKKMKNPPQGWKTDRGMIYIRYGQPLRIARLRPSHSAAGGSGFELTEIWYYNNFSFAFSDEYMTGNFILGSRNRLRGVNFKELVDVHYKENSEIYEHRYEGSYFDVPNFTADFRAKEDNTQTDIYYAVPKSSLMFTHIDTSKVASVLRGFFVFDDEWNELQRSVSRENLYFHPLLNPDIDFHVISQDKLEIPPGNYNFAFELIDEKSRNTYAQRYSLDIDSYKPGGLKVSDIVLASLIDSTFEKSQFSSHELAYDLQIVPNPARSYQKVQPMYLYFEVYNLRVVTPEGTSFDVTYHIKTADRKKSVTSKVFSVLSKPFGAGEDKVQISSSYIYQGYLPMEKVYLSIDMSALKNNVYDLAVIVKDINTGEVISKEAQFMVQDDTIYYLY
ncbi:GWxTD domain-containing protein [candidate division KSB1 bacterium]